MDNNVPTKAHGSSDVIGQHWRDDGDLIFVVKRLL